MEQELGAFFQKDSIWNLWKFNSIEYFQKLVSNLTLKPEVAEDVIQRFEIIKKLVLHSYFVYEFLDIASDQALLTFEMALKKRYLELTGKDFESNRDELLNLIKWGAEQGLFEEDEQAVQHLRRLRNYAVHSKENSTMGNMAFMIVADIVELINGLYENVDSRKERKAEQKLINKHLSNIAETGAILKLDYGRFIIFSANLLYYDNNSIPHVYYFLLWPIFDPLPKEDQSVDISKPILVSCNSCEVTDNMLSLQIYGAANEVTINKIFDSEHRSKYQKWKNAFDTSDFPLQMSIDSHIVELRQQLRKGKIL